jgi:type I restriction enzyme M protein
VEEHGGEDGLLEEVKNDKGNITKGNITTRIKGVRNDPDYAEELAVLNAYLALMNLEATKAKQVREEQKALDTQVVARYQALSEDEIRTLVVDDKWLATLAARVQTQLDRISQAMTSCLGQLAVRYATPLPRLSEEIEILSGRVNAHLMRMGFACN